MGGPKASREVDDVFAKVESPIRARRDLWITTLQETRRVDAHGRGRARWRERGNGDAPPREASVEGDKNAIGGKTGPVVDKSRRFWPEDRHNFLAVCMVAICR